MRVAIIGLGVTGRAQADMFGEDVWITYDVKGGHPYPRREIASCHFAVVCVDTPSPEGPADLTHFWNAIDDLPRLVPVLIRSTVPPHTTDRVVLEHPSAPVAHAPEFMYERPGGMWASPAEVPFMLLGGQDEAREYFMPMVAKAFPGRIHQCSALVAELAKYTVNLYWATRVTFVNEMARIAAAYGADWEHVRQAWLEDPRMTPDYTAMAGFGPGFGGSCWPKDLTALMAAADAAGYKARFLEAVHDANERFRS